MIYRRDLKPVGRFLVDHPRLIPVGTLCAALVCLPVNAFMAALEAVLETWEDRKNVQRDLEAIAEREDPR